MSTNRRRLLAFVGVLALLFGLAMLHPYPRQSLFGPTIRGRPWCAWENEVRRHFDRGARDESFWAKALTLVGVQGDRMDSNELFNHEEMIPLLLHLSNDPDPVVRQNVVCQFYWFDKLQDKSALPALETRLHDADARCRIEAAMAVATIDPSQRTDAILVKILDDPTSEYRYPAMRGLTYVASASDDAFAAMLRYSGDADQNVRLELMHELWRFESKAIPTLMQGIRDADPVVRAAAVDSLGMIGPHAKGAIPPLQQRLSDADKRVRDAAGNALATIEPKRFGHLIGRAK